jgi:hypothetical protein
MTKKIWFFNWLGTGSTWENGYNFVMAGNKKEALEEVNRQFGNSKLKPDLTTLKVVTQDYVNQVDKSYSGCFD